MTNKKMLLSILFCATMSFAITITGGCQMKYEVGELIVPDKSEFVALTQSVNQDGALQIIKPMNYDVKLAIEKGLCHSSGFDEKYLIAQTLYRRFLEQYLSERLSLQAFDDILANSELRFIPISDDEKNFYQKYSTFGFKYIYLRNNLPIERLEKTDLDAIEAYINSGSTDATDELMEIVQRTFTDVIIANPNLDSNSNIGFSNDGQKIAPNNAVVFEVGHAVEFDEKGNFVNTATEVKKDDYIEKELIPKMSKQLSEELGEKVVVFLK